MDWQDGLVGKSLCHVTLATQVRSSEPPVGGSDSCKLSFDHAHERILHVYVNHTQ